jgi:hypothetical protein
MNRCIHTGLLLLRIIDNQTSLSWGEVTCGGITPMTVKF